MKPFGHHLAQPVLDAIMEMTEEEPSKLFLAYDVGRHLLETTGTNPGTDRVSDAAWELKDRGLIFHSRRCTTTTVGRLREPGWPVRL